MNFEKKLDILKQGIKEKRLVVIIADIESKKRIGSKERVERTCVPCDYGQTKKMGVRFCFKTLDSPDGGHIFLCLENNLIDIRLLDENFDPSEYITWSPTNWHINRDWGDGFS